MKANVLHKPSPEKALVWSQGFSKDFSRIWGLVRKNSLSEVESSKMIR